MQACRGLRRVPAQSLMHRRRVALSQANMWSRVKNSINLTDFNVERSWRFWREGLDHAILPQTPSDPLYNIVEGSQACSI
jgi:hypothetical protein